MKEKLGQDYCSGMSKRFYAACAVLQGIISGICSNKEMFQITEYSANKSGLSIAEYIARESYIAADELLKQENEQ